MKQVSAALVAAAFLGSALIGTASAQQIPGPYGPAVTLEQARSIVDAAHRAAQARNYRMAFAVALPSGELILLEVMDGTQFASIAVAQQKARTSARFRRPTKAFADSIASGNLSTLSTADVHAGEGGVPIMSNGLVIGALGISGATGALDAEIATAALASVNLD